jgi:hypothetical protein
LPRFEQSVPNVVDLPDAEVKRTSSAQNDDLAEEGPSAADAENPSNPEENCKAGDEIRTRNIQLGSDDKRFS